jgi:hypothetical protein
MVVWHSCQGRYLVVVLWGGGLKSLSVSDTQGDLTGAYVIIEEGWRTWLGKGKENTVGCYLHWEGKKAAVRLLSTWGGNRLGRGQPGRAVKPVAWQAAVLGLGRGQGEQ